MTREGLASLLAVLLLLLPGCGKQAADESPALKLTWGMTVEEVSNTIGYDILRDYPNSDVPVPLYGKIAYVTCVYEGELLDSMAITLHEQNYTLGYAKFSQELTEKYPDLPLVDEEFAQELDEEFYERLLQNIQKDLDVALVYRSDSYVELCSEAYRIVINARFGKEDYYGNIITLFVLQPLHSN